MKCFPAMINFIVSNRKVKVIVCRTVSMRLRGLGEDGESISGLMPTLEQQFGRLGLTLKKDENTFLSTYEIMEQLAKVWDDISDFDRANILESVAGKSLPPYMVTCK